MRSYYGRPIIKEPVWTWEIPAYFFTGGLAGASAVLSSAARVAGNEKLARTALYIGAAADIASPRAAHLRPRSARALPPHAPRRQGHVADEPRLLGAARQRRSLDDRGAPPAARAAASPCGSRPSIVAALAGPPLATYTGVLVADTAVPVWHDGRRELPWIFGASAAASAGAAASIFVQPRDAGPARRLAVAGVLAEGALMQAMERRLGTVGEVYHQGEAGKLSWAAKGLATAGAALLARRGRKSRASAVLGGALVCAGELCLRWAVFKAGFQSARDPKYVVESQRRRAEQQGTKATTKPGDGRASAEPRLREGRPGRNAAADHLPRPDDRDHALRRARDADPAESRLPHDRLARARGARADAAPRCRLGPGPRRARRSDRILGSRGRPGSPSRSRRSRARSVRRVPRRRRACCSSPPPPGCSSRLQRRWSTRCSCLPPCSW